MQKQRIKQEEKYKLHEYEQDWHHYEMTMFMIASLYNIYSNSNPVSNLNPLLSSPSALIHMDRVVTPQETPIREKESSIAKEAEVRAKSPAQKIEEIDKLEENNDDNDDNTSYQIEDESARCEIADNLQQQYID
eukprot:8674816-Ditylum_brightwellii.AAC.1